MRAAQRSGLLAVALVLLGAAALGCGSPSNLDLCHATCDSEQRCGVLSDAQAQNCNTTCENNKGALSDQQTKDDNMCKNAGDVRSQTLKCLQSDCNKINSCLQAIDNTCIAK